MKEKAGEKELIAYCGAYCGDCHGYKGKIMDLARDLRKELRQANFAREAKLMSGVPYFAALKDYPQCYEVLGTLVRLRCKRTCRGNGGPPGCKVRDCCRQKGIEGCWLCSEFETCEKLDSLKKPYDEDVHLKNLRILSKTGVDSFISGKRY